MLDEETFRNHNTHLRSQREAVLDTAHNVTREAAHTVHNEQHPTPTKMKHAPDFNIEIVECSQVDHQLVTSMDSLIRQLSSTSSPPTFSELESILQSPMTHMFVAIQQRHTGHTDHDHTDHSVHTASSTHTASSIHDVTADKRVATSEIVGVLTLVVFRIPTGVKSRIEDVVVTESVRGQRIGEHLCHKALEKARLLGATHTDLTSRPERKSANRLYLRMGFQPRDSNVYRFRL